VRILNVCAERQAELARQRDHIRERIALQRAGLERGLGGLRRPLKIADKSLQVAASLREHAGVVTVVAVPVLYMARRVLKNGAVAAWRLSRHAGKWWALWKLGRRAALSLGPPRRA
jgi:hypothetical protein